MKSIKSFITLLLGLSLISSCLVKHEISFNEDFSGTYHFTLDFSQLNSMMPDSSKSENSQMNSSFDTLINDLRIIPGITNIRINDNSSEGILEIIYDFNNIDALNASIKTSTKSNDKMAPQSAPLQFKLKGNSLAVNQEKSNMAKDSASAALNEMFTYELKVSFKNNFKKAKINNQAQKSENSITQTGKYFDILSNKTNWKIKF